MDQRIKSAQKIVPTHVPNDVWVTTIEADPLADVVTCHRLDPAKSQPLEQVPTGITWHPGRDNGGMAGDAIGLSPAYVKGETALLEQMAAKLEMCFGLILKNEVSSDRKAGLPRII